MSIKKLFEAGNKNKNYSDYQTEKEKFSPVESAENAQELILKDNTFVPEINYSIPAEFVKYGSAYLYYKGALDKISGFYPYDGSDAEKNKFYNGLLEVEKYIFNNRYPRTNGYINISSDGWGSRTSTTDGFGLPATAEYITIKGGPLTASGDSMTARGPNPYSDAFTYSNIYDENIYQSAGLPDDYGVGTRLSNLRSNFDTGVTVEFWLKTGSINYSNTTQKQVVFDMWNNYSAATTNYGRLTLALHTASAASPSTSQGNAPFVYTLHSGSSAGTHVVRTIGTGSAATASFGSWNHYALSFANSGSNFVVKLYVNGGLNSTNVHTSTTVAELNSKNMMARLGALLTSPSGSSAAAGAGKLSGSLDEFRFWKQRRSAKQVAENYFVPVHGGANSDISNAALGVYYKFNEGITGVTAEDQVVLDYAGRISNGIWTGYPSGGRNTGSAIVTAGAAATEYKDPIIRTSNSLYQNLSASLCASGSYYDLNNSSKFRDYAPNWVIELQDNSKHADLDLISHICGAYFDKVYQLIRATPTFKGPQYTSASATPLPFARHLPQSLGLYTPDLFIDSTIMERLLNRTNDSLFANELQDTKNLIFLNLYNNLANIYKAKGTEKAIRNVLRCFYMDDSLFQLRTYGKNVTYTLENNLQQHIAKDTRVSFTTTDNSKAIVYQKADSSNAESIGFISGSNSGSANDYQSAYGATMEADVVFPAVHPTYDPFSRNFVSSSLFGLHTVETASANSLNGSDTTLVTNNYANFQVYAVRDRPHSHNIYFRLSSSNYPYPLPYLTSSTFFSVYTNERWNLSVRIKPQKYPLSTFVSGANAPSYDVIFRGVSAKLGSIDRQFEVSGTVNYTVGSNFLKAPKRIYVGADRVNLTGAVTNLSDVFVSNTKYWSQYIDNVSIDQHLYDSDNRGVSGSYQNISPIGTLNQNFDLLRSNTLALDWTFYNLTGSDSSGNFNIMDFSSGSSMIRDNYAWLGNIVGYQHTGYGYGFATSSTTVADKNEANLYKFVDPEAAIDSSMIKILSEDDTLYDVVETVPSYLNTFEKSMYANISEEMLTFLAGVIDFNNIIGEPVNRYRSRYKAMEKIREAFFRRVTDVTQVEKFIDYYKWFDDAIAVIIGQLMPASSDFVEDTMNVIESHVLERNKYENKFPTLEMATPDPEAAIGGMVSIPRWEFAHFPDPSEWVSPTRGNPAFNVFYWKNMAERSIPPIAVKNNATINTQRETIKRIVTTKPHLSRSLPIFSTTDGAIYQRNTYASRNYQRFFSFKAQITGSDWDVRGGVNFAPGKKIDFTYNALRPAGPVNTEGNRYVPENVLLAFAEDFTGLLNDRDPKAPNKKIKRNVKVLHGRNYEDGQGYQTVKSSMAFPFNLISSSVISGYQKEVSDNVSGNVMITNLHNDVYGPDMEKPLQGPFTEYAVGGHQSRHVGLNYKSATRELDNYRTRPEAWKLLLGTCPTSSMTIEDSGAIGMVGPDYPWPEANDEGATPYPMTASQKAVYYRGMTAKRPVNIRNIHHTTGSPTILGNYNENYEVVSTVGAYANPRAFIDSQPTLPSNVFQSNTTSSMTANTWLDSVTRFAGTRSLGRKLFVEPYYIGNYLRGNDPALNNSSVGRNKSVIRSRFNSPGGPETHTPAYTDFRSDSFSAYNSWNNRNLSVIKPSQGPSGSWESFDGNLQTGSIRVNDILNKPYGLRSHLARHTARFGRDSLFQTGTLDAPGTPTRLQAPGATYNQLPGFHKIHRNNITRLRKNDSIVLTTYGPLSNTVACNFDETGGADKGPALLLTSSTPSWDDGTQLYQALTSSGFTYSGWHYFAPGSSVRRFFNMNRTSAGAFPGLSIAKSYSASRHRLIVLMATANSDDSSRQQAEWQVTGNVGGDFEDESWLHVAVAWTGSNGSLTSAKPVIYINGVSHTVTEDAAPLDYYPQNWRVPASYKDFSTVKIEGDNFVTFGGNHSNKTWSYSGSLDEVSVWKRKLTSTDVTRLYNGGTPCDVTASAVYTEGSADDLWEWIRMGDGKNGSNAIDSTNPGTSGASNRITGEINSLIFMPITQKTFSNQVSITASSPAVKAGCGITVTNITEVSSYSSGSLYDNFNVKHQIPRATQQYSWITSSIAPGGKIKTFGFAPADFYYSSSLHGQQEFISLLSASDGGSYLSLGSSRNYGWSQQEINSDSNLTEFLADNLVGLSYAFVDPVNTSTNTLGVGENISNYFNTGALGYLNQVVAHGKAMGLNGLLLKRGNGYGFNSWNQLRQAYSPILRRQAANNQVVVNMGSTPGSPTVFEMPPVSMRGRTGIVNFDLVTDESVTPTYALECQFTNEKIYYNTPAMDDLLGVSLVNFTTPFEQTIAAVRGSDQYSTNWVKYSENIFPSQRNEFLSRSTQRVGYDNEFWRTEQSARLTLGSQQTNSCGVYTVGISDGTLYSRTLSQSSWPLDAPHGFLTRSNANNWYTNKGAFLGIRAAYEAPTDLANAAGELQNCYSTYLSNPNWGQAGPDNSVFLHTRPAALYARKHQLTTPASNVCASGIELPETGAISTSIWRAQNQCSGTFAGEAVWQAGPLAGIIRNSTYTASLPWGGSQTTNQNYFQKSSSAPWYDGYSDFNADLKLLARGFSVVPEFRLSEHLQDYLEGGTLNNGKTDTFEIAGTGINSSTVTNGTSSFYLDYSNTEFLQEFMRIKQETLLNAKEIKLVCSAACKFIPYKGFYPADRTLQLVERFKNDYASTMYGRWNVAAASYVKSQNDIFPIQGAASGIYGGIAKPLFAPLFNPGILYNTIKSGIAVDWPLVTVGSKYQKVYYGAPSDFGGENPQNWAITCRSGASGDSPIPSAASRDAYDTYNSQMLGFNRTFFDTRVPFEGIISPETYLAGQNLFSLDSHPSSSQYGLTASYAGTPGLAYTRMMRNFLGAVPSFFLANNSFSKLSTPTSYDTYTFSGDEVYMARLKMYRSMAGPRSYEFESGSQNYYGPQADAFSGLGATAVIQSYNGSDVEDGVHYLTGTSYPLPQDPRNAPGYHENFTMYSRPTAFGPAIAGLPGGALCLSGALYYTNTIYDSFSGHNPAYTPPYYDGEAWCDLIFRPRTGVSYDLSMIVQELTSSYLRFDAGYQSGSMASQNASFGCGPRTPLIYTADSYPQRNTSIPAIARPAIAPYSGVNINKNSMQVSASLRLRGIEKVDFVSRDKFNVLESTRNQTNGRKWVIQPRFETPMLNFNDNGDGLRPLTSSELSLPTFASCSVPRGMWHQFGVIEPDQSKGIFMEIGDVPTNWLSYNHSVINTGSVYNQFSKTNGLDLDLRAKSLCELVGFDAGTSNARLGALKEELVVNEAIIAVPYVSETIDEEQADGTLETYDRKQFVSIPEYRLESALTDAIGTAAGDSLLSAGESIRRQVELMQKYILPPEFDFINNRDLTPVAMYIFEFSHTFDQDDLSYIWQNIAPRDYGKMTMQISEVGHELITTELLSETNLTEAENLRWMVFKVKHKGQEDYYDYLTLEAGQSSHGLSERIAITEGDSNYKLEYNWPYDYFSIIEKIKIDAEILYHSEASSLAQAATSDTPNTTGLSAEAMAPGWTAPEDTVFYGSVADMSVGVEGRTLNTAGISWLGQQSAVGAVANIRSEYSSPTYGASTTTTVASNPTSQDQRIGGPVLSQEALNRLRDD
tara:strand:- start:14207 stop:25129 length:10923 start_codon:yes stop_codon:yes gene_type:complete